MALFFYPDELQHFLGISRRELAGEGFADVDGGFSSEAFLRFGVGGECDDLLWRIVWPEEHDFIWDEGLSGVWRAS